VLAVSLPEITSLISTLIWPLVVLTIVVIYRKEIIAFGGALSDRVSRLSVAGVTIELITASEAPETTVSAVVEFIDAATGPGVASSDAGSSLQAAIYTSGADFVKIDLRRGRGWLTSRLFIFALILGAAGVKRLVFVEKTDTTSQLFVGSASPAEVAERLARRFPWLSYALEDAQCARLYTPLHVPRPADPLRDPTWASYISEQFLAHPLVRAEPQVALQAEVEPEFVYSECKPPTPAPPSAVVRPSPPDGSPQLTAITPSFGSPAGGTLVTVVGKNLAGTTGVSFGTSWCPEILPGNTDAELRVVTPAGVGRTDVRVYLAGGVSSPTDEWSPEFWFTSYPLPDVVNVSPTEGPPSGGTQITITGTGFAQTRQVRIGNARAAVTTRAETQVTAVTPPGEGRATVAIASMAGSSRSADDWVVVHHHTGSDYAEHAEWVRNGDHLLSLLGDAVDNTRVRQTKDMPRGELERELLGESSDFVCVVGPDDGFRRVINRRAAVERVISERLESARR